MILWSVRRQSASSVRMFVELRELSVMVMPVWSDRSNRIASHDGQRCKLLIRATFRLRHRAESLKAWPASSSPRRSRLATIRHGSTRQLPMCRSEVQCQKRVATRTSGVVESPAESRLPVTIIWGRLGATRSEKFAPRPQSWPHKSASARA